MDTKAHQPHTESPLPSAAHSPNLDSFYHLSDNDLESKVCNGIACFVARHLNQERWQKSLAQNSKVYCLGKCFNAPSTSSDDGEPRIEIHSRKAIVLRRIANGGASTIQAYTKSGGYCTLQNALQKSPLEIVRMIEVSSLRGRGGAGFSTGKKWRAVFEQNSLEKFVVANADEGDPGVYVDRFILEKDPHCLIEAMTIAAYAIGANKGYIYLRVEYPLALAILQNALAEALREGFLGERILQSDFSFDIQIVVGQGSYVCGEETALLNSIEGKRPEVRPRPPYPTQAGLFAKPTLINNVETLANIPWIIQNGGEAYRELGFSNSRGTKVIALNSLFKRPGLYEIEFGCSVRHLVEDLGGGLKTGEIKGLLIGAPLAGIIPPYLFDTKFGFEELRTIGASIGHGGVVAFDEQTAIAELIHHVFEFAAFESCGKCTPCRLGSRQIEQIFRQVLTGGRLSSKEKIEFEEINRALLMTSLCGLGSGVAEFAESAVRYYGKELQQCFA